MRSADVEAFRDVPFYFWVKDASGRYLWANRASETFFGGSPVGKTDHDLLPAEQANALRADDVLVLDTDDPLRRHEIADEAQAGTESLSVCKWADDLDGERCAFGISFLIDSDR